MSGACGSVGDNDDDFDLNAGVPLFANLRLPGRCTLAGLGLGTTVRSLGGTGRSLTVGIASTCLRILFGRRLDGITRDRMKLDGRRLGHVAHLRRMKGTSPTRITRTGTHITRSRVDTMRTSGGCQLTLLSLDRLLRLPAPRGFSLTAPSARLRFSPLASPSRVCGRTVLCGPNVGTTRCHLRNDRGGIHVTGDDCCPRLSFSTKLNAGFCAMGNGTNSGFNGRVGGGLGGCTKFDLGVPLFGHLTAHGHMHATHLRRAGLTLRLSGAGGMLCGRVRRT